MFFRGWAGQGVFKGRGVPNIVPVSNNCAVQRGQRSKRSFQAGLGGDACGRASVLPDSSVGATGATKRFQRAETCHHQPPHQQKTA